MSSPKRKTKSITLSLVPSWPATVSTWFAVLGNCKPAKRAQVLADARSEMMRLAEAYEELQAKHEPEARKLRRTLSTTVKALKPFLSLACSVDTETAAGEVPGCDCWRCEHVLAARAALEKAGAK